MVCEIYGLRNLKDIQNSRQNCSKNKLVRDDVVTRIHHGSCSLWVMGSCTLLNLMYFSKNLPGNVLPHSVDSTEKASPL